MLACSNDKSGGHDGDEGVETEVNGTQLDGNTTLYGLVTDTRRLMSCGRHWKHILMRRKGSRQSYLCRMASLSRVFPSTFSHAAR